MSSRWDEVLARCLIRHAARDAPPPLSQRLQEEWLADLAERGGRASRLRLALGCCWATRVIAHEYPATNVAAGATASGAKTMSLYAHHDALFSSRTIALLLIACLHTVLIYALATGLVHRTTTAIPSPMRAIVLRDTQPRDLPPPPPQPNLVRYRLTLPPPDLSLEVPSDGHAITDVITGPAQDLSPPPSSPKTVKRIVGGPGRGFPNTEDYYPSASRRVGESGVVAVRVCVDPNGRLTADPSVVQSSGSPRLDEGALRLAKAGSGHYLATTEDGRPVSSCYPFRIRFELRDPQ
jgi:periplasmic protein TonB